MSLLDVLQNADFEYTRHIPKVWGEVADDIPSIHKDVRDEFTKACRSLARQEDTASPLGLVITGPGGSGKTHLLGSLRKETIRNGGFFILADMSDVNRNGGDFWEMLLHYFMGSLYESSIGAEQQIVALVRKLVSSSLCGVDPLAIPVLSQDELSAAMQVLLDGLDSRDVKAPGFQDVVRATVMGASHNAAVRNCGRAWLRGLQPDSNIMNRFGLSHRPENARRIIEGISWMMALDNGFSVFALDQLDNMVEQYHISASGKDSDAAVGSRSQIMSVGNGLSALRDCTHRSLMVVSCLTNTWKSFRSLVLSTVIDRYHSPIHLSPLDSEEQVGELVAVRMKSAFARAGENAPYPTWPFPPEAIRSMIDKFPREILKECTDHIKECLRQGVADEKSVDAADTPEPARGVEAAGTQTRIDEIEARFQQERDKAVPDKYKDKEQEDSFWGSALDCLAHAYRCGLPSIANADISIDGDTSNGLHAKVLNRATGGQSKTRSLSMRALLATHHKSFQPKMRSAIDGAGMERDRDLRKLVLIRFDGNTFPGGRKTEELKKRFHDGGGMWIAPSDDDIRTLAALVAVVKAFPNDWRRWAAAKKPVDRMRLLRDELVWLRQGWPRDGMEANESGDFDVADVEVDMISPATVPQKAHGRRKGADAGQRIPIGKKERGGALGQDVTLLLETLQQHVAIVAGSGSGKTVLTRRLVEEAALCGTPAIVIDIANDLARMGQPWPEEPSSWTDEDREKARRYFEHVEVKVWTPGRSGGNPLNLRQMPDFAAVADDPDDLNSAINMGIGTLRDIMKINNNTKAGIVGSAMKWMARNGGGGLDTLVEVLSELPDDSEAAGIHDKAQRMASDMAGHLKGTLLTSSLLQGSDEVVDIGELLTGTNGRTRISVVNLSGFGDNLDDQQHFVNQLAMALFGWIKKHPATGLGGLFVLDEAKDFIPSLKKTPCKDSMLRYAAQARKYGMGLVVATQEPKSVDTKILNNAGTQFFGRMNSPATIEAAEGILGRSGVVSGLPRGNFYLKTGETGGNSTRMAAPLCLSYHASAALTPEEVLELARK